MMTNPVMGRTSSHKVLDEKNFCLFAPSRANGILLFICTLSRANGILRHDRMYVVCAPSRVSACDRHLSYFICSEEQRGTRNSWACKFGLADGPA